MKKKKKGRPCVFKPEYCEQATKLCVLGATDREVAAFFKVTQRTVYRWQIEFPEFCEALKVGKETADERVQRSLYSRAVGYSFDSVHITNYQGAVTQTKIVEHVPPDTTACIFWLKNRRPTEWREKHEVDHTVTLIDELKEARERAGISEVTAPH